MAKSYTDLHTAVARAERALSVLEPHQDKRGIAFKIHVLGLAYMVMVAREEITRAERFALALVERGSGPSTLALTTSSPVNTDALPLLERIRYFLFQEE